MYKTIRNLIMVVAASFAVTMTLSAQDLSAQRGESQNLGGLFGEKLDHGGLVINPTPQSMKMLRAMPLDITGGVTLIGKAEEFASDIDFLKQNPMPEMPKGKKSKRGLQPEIQGVKLSIEYGDANLKKSGAYTLAIEAENITIKAYDKLGAFYAIQTLRQVFESPVSAEGKLPTLSITDWPDLQYRGVVEGFYGTPWSHEVRLSLIDTYGRYKMN